MPYTDATIQLLSTEGRLVENEANARYLPLVADIDDARLSEFYRQMTAIRAFDIEAANLQRQGQLALWVPSLGQEAAQVGSALAARPQDHIFPSYREHVVGRIRGLDPMRIIELLRGLDHGGWNPAEVGNFHLYTLVIGAHVLHSTGYAMGVGFDGASGTGDPESDVAVMVYFGDGATSQGSVSEALVFAASYQTPQVFFVQNNQWAISVPVSRQSRIPLHRRGDGFGVPNAQIDGNDVLASYLVSLEALDAARGGEGPRLIEAVTYRVGAHTTSDDPTKYRTDDEHRSWLERDPITRFEAYLRSVAAPESLFTEAAAEAADFAADTRRRTLALESPPLDRMFDHLYSEPHPALEAQREWLVAYEAQFGGAA